MIVLRNKSFALSPEMQARIEAHKKFIAEQKAKGEEAVRKVEQRAVEMGKPNPELLREINRMNKNYTQKTISGLKKIVK